MTQEDVQAHVVPRIKRVYAQLVRYKIQYLGQISTTKESNKLGQLM